MSTRKHISQREAHRLAKRVKDLEYKLRDFGSIEDRTFVEAWAECPNWVKTVRLVEKLGFEARVRAYDGDAGKLHLMAVRRKGNQ